jgi:hypothetical protein
VPQSFAQERIEQWPFVRLQPYARNAKAHGADQVAKIAASMAEFGWTVPCLVAEDGELIAGHGRVLPSMQRGLILRQKNRTWSHWGLTRRQTMNDHSARLIAGSGA